MAEKDKLLEQKVKYNGIFDFKEIYQFLHRWFIEEGYDVEERKYVEEVQGGDEKKVEIKWLATKKISDYFKYEIKADYRILGMKKVEVEQDGKRIKTNSGTFEIKYQGVLHKDYENTWENNPMMKFLRGVYDKFIVEGTISKYEEKLIQEVDKVTEETKAFLTATGLKGG
jgi:hypothetical protein